jgi:putative membrane protein
MSLTPEDRAHIEAAIAAAEARTNAEIAVVVADASDDYAGFPLVWAGGLALLGGGALALIRPLTLAPTLFMVEAALFIAAAAACSLPRWRARFAPRWVREARTRWMSELQFAARVENRTTDAVGLLLYVSRAERFAEIRVDRRIATALPQATWEAVLTDFTRAMRGGTTVAAVATAIGRCAEILAPHFPPLAGQSDEISNRVVEF